MLYDKLKNYSKSGIYPFHMPGHKRTDITEEGIIPYNIDITEIHDFDNLHSPNGVIDEIQKKAAKLYNAKNAFILINGSTGGILSAIRSMTNQGDKILMARNCHKSVYNSAELFNLNVDYIFVVCSLADDTADIAIFFKHINGFIKVRSVLEQRTSAKVMQVILPDLPNVLGAYLVQYTLCLDRPNICIA